MKMTLVYKEKFDNNNSLFMWLSSSKLGLNNTVLQCAAL